MPVLTTSTTAAVVLPRNRLRRSFVIQNEDAVINVFIKRERSESLTVSSTDHDHRIGPAAALAVNTLTDGKESIEDRWSVVADSGSPIISFFETEDVVR